MKISYIFPQFLLPSQAFALSDILALRDAGHEVIVHTVKPPQPRQDVLDRRNGVPPDLQILRPSLRGAARWPSLSWRSRSVFAALLGRIVKNFPTQPIASLTAFLTLPRCAEIAEEIARFDPDVVHLFWSRRASQVFPILEDRRNRATRSAFVGAYDLVEDDFLTRLAIEEAEIVFTHAEANRKFVTDRAQPGKLLHVVYRGIPITEMSEDGMERDCNLWVTASALYPAKNVEAVIRAFARAKSSNPVLQLGIYGDGPDRTRLEALARSLAPDHSVRFHGHVERSALMAEMRRAQLFLLLSKKPSERLPNVVKEAMLAGCGIVVSQSEGIEELIIDDDWGTVVDVGDEDAIDRAIASISAETAEVAATRREAARQFIKRKFSSAESMRQYSAAWDSARALKLAGAGADSSG